MWNLFLWAASVMCMNHLNKNGSRDAKTKVSHAYFYEENIVRVTSHINIWSRVVSLDMTTPQWGVLVSLGRRYVSYWLISFMVSGRSMMDHLPTMRCKAMHQSQQHHLPTLSQHPKNPASEAAASSRVLWTLSVHHPILSSSSTKNFPTKQTQKQAARALTCRELDAQTSAGQQRSKANNSPDRKCKYFCRPTFPRTRTKIRRSSIWKRALVNILCSHLILAAVGKLFSLNWESQFYYAMLWVVLQANGTLDGCCPFPWNLVIVKGIVTSRSMHIPVCFANHL